MDDFLNNIFAEKVFAENVFELYCHLLFDGFEKAREDIANYFFVIMNALWSCDYTWSVIRNAAVFIPLLICYQYEYYSLTKRIYGLTLALHYELRKKDSVRIMSPPVEKGKKKKSSSYDIQSKQMRTIWPSSAPVVRNPLFCRKLTETSDMSGYYDKQEMYRIKSTPTMVFGKKPRIRSVLTLDAKSCSADVTDEQSFTNMHQDEFVYCQLQSSDFNWKKFRRNWTQDLKMHPLYERTDSTVIIGKADSSVPVSKSKKLKKDHFEESARGVRAQAKTAENSLLLKPMFERVQIHSRNKGLSTSVGASFLKFPKVKGLSKTEDSHFNRKWREIQERLQSLRNRRIARIQESANKKMQEKEKQNKIEVLKRRAIRTSFMKEKEKIFVGDRTKRPENKLNGISFDPAAIQSSPVTPNVKVLRGTLYRQKLAERTTTVLVNFSRSPKIDNLKENEMSNLLNEGVTKVDSISKSFKPSDRDVTARAFETPVIEKSQTELIKENENKSTFEKDMEVLRQKESGKSCQDSGEASNFLPQSDVLAQITSALRMEELRKLDTCEISEGTQELGHFTKLKVLEESTTDFDYNATDVTQVEKLPKEENTSATCDVKKSDNPVMKRFKRRLRKTGINEVTAGSVNFPKKSHKSERGMESLDSSSALDPKGIHFTSLQKKEIELRKRLDDHVREMCDKPCSGKIEKLQTSESFLRSSKNARACFLKKIVKGVKFRSVSSISLKRVPLKPTKKKAPLCKTFRVSTSSDYRSSKAENKSYKVVGYLKGKNALGSRKKRLPRKRSPPLELYKSTVAAAARCDVASNRYIDSSRSAITTEDISSVSQEMRTACGSTQYLSGDDFDSFTLTKTISTELLSDDSIGQSHKRDHFQRSNLHATASLDQKKMSSFKGMVANGDTRQPAQGTLSRFKSRMQTIRPVPVRNPAVAEEEWNQRMLTWEKKKECLSGSDWGCSFRDICGARFTRNRPRRSPITSNKLCDSSLRKSSSSEEEFTCRSLTKVSSLPNSEKSAATQTDLEQKNGEKINKRGMDKTVRDVLQLQRESSTMQLEVTAETQSEARSGQSLSLTDSSYVQCSSSKSVRGDSNQSSAKFIKTVLSPIQSESDCAMIEKSSSDENSSDGTDDTIEIEKQESKETSKLKSETTSLEITKTKSRIMPTPVQEDSSEKSIIKPKARINWSSQISLLLQAKATPTADEIIYLKEEEKICSVQKSNSVENQVKEDVNKDNVEKDAGGLKKYCSSITLMSDNVKSSGPESPPLDNSCGEPVQRKESNCKIKFDASNMEGNFLDDDKKDDSETHLSEDDIEIVPSTSTLGSPTHMVLLPSCSFESGLSQVEELPATSSISNSNSIEDDIVIPVTPTEVVTDMKKTLYNSPNFHLRERSSLHAMFSSPDTEMFGNRKKPIFQPVFMRTAFPEIEVSDRNLALGTVLDPVEMPADSGPLSETSVVIFTDSLETVSSEPWLGYREVRLPEMSSADFDSIRSSVGQANSENRDAFFDRNSCRSLLLGPSKSTITWVNDTCCLRRSEVWYDSSACTMKKGKVSNPKSSSVDYDSFGEASSEF